MRFVVFSVICGFALLGKAEDGTGTRLGESWISTVRVIVLLFLTNESEVVEAAVSNMSEQGRCDTAACENWVVAAD